MKATHFILSSFVLGVTFVTAFAGEWKSGVQWKEPVVVNPGPETAPANVPSDAIVLFDGKDMSAWENSDSWKVEDGVVYSGKGSVVTKQSFGSIQLHLEFASPSEVKGNGQGRGNSGIKFGSYEIQILDSYENKTYYDGQCGALYKQNPPAVNVCRKPGEWQTYDIIWMRPIFDGQTLVKPGYVTVFQNGVLVQNHIRMVGETAWYKPPEFTEESFKEKYQLLLQDHGNPVRFRNIWVREISDSPVQAIEDDSPVKPIDVFGEQD